MTTKLTLTIEQEIIKVAKTYAQRKGRSLSEIIENYLKALIAKDTEREELSPRVKKITGAAKLPKDFNYKKTLEEEVKRKFLR